ncbi:hypothetical protein RUM8411_02732 [Ruegeria meonggei]|uniref:Uncharacterized protein n=1 Tax=Ruegeria meonggei TaxID=1446476 RepID=A0A1X6ZMU0_9RHOB|nr:hypothetical protein RUM8411_02732 [Ruegeria meonggei]
MFQTEARQQSIGCGFASLRKLLNSRIEQALVDVLDAPVFVLF